MMMMMMIIICIIYLPLKNELCADVGSFRAFIFYFLFVFGRALPKAMPDLCSRTVLNRKQSGNGNVDRTTANGFQNIVPDHTLFLDIYCLFLSNLLLLW